MPIREFIPDVPAPRCDHRKNESAAFAEQLSITGRIAIADLFGHMGEVELDRPTATRLEVDEEQTAVSAEEVAWMRLTVQQLLRGSAAEDLLTRTVKRVEEEMPVALRERGCFVSGPD
jgi:hypothetical protein